MVSDETAVEIKKKKRIITAEMLRMLAATAMPKPPVPKNILW